jgi:hypothetical protein
LLPTAAFAEGPATPAPTTSAAPKTAPTTDPAPATPAATAAPATTAPAAAAPAAGAPTAPQTSDEAFDVRVKGLEEQVNDIKEKIFRTKARLLLLQETVVDGEIISGAKAVITHKNEMGSTFVLESAAYQLDGLPIFTKVDVKGDLADKPSIEVFNNRVIPGNHQLVVKLEYRGHGFGPITYLDGYRFKVVSNWTFHAEAGKITNLQAIAYEKGGPFAQIKDKPDVRYEVSVSKELGVSKSGGTSTEAKPEAGAAKP